MLDPGGARRLITDAAEDALVIYAPEPWEQLIACAPNVAALQAPGVGQDALDRLVAEAPDRPLVIGIGGGTALDCAKYMALRRDIRLILVPSILSVDAAFTREAGVRRSGQVTYVGPVTPERIVVDPELIRNGPAELNRAGVGDLLSCHTALRDWRIAVEDGSPAGPAVPWDADLAAVGDSTLAALATHAEDIGAVTDRGIALLAEGFARIGAACSRAGHARFEEGSEHFFAYALEAETGRAYIHGELIAFATLALAVFQENDPAFVVSVIARSRVGASPGHLGLDEALFVRVFTNLRAYVRAADLWWSCLDRQPISESNARAVWRQTLHHLQVSSEECAR